MYFLWWIRQTRQPFQKEVDGDNRMQIMIIYLHANVCVAPGVDPVLRVKVSTLQLCQTP